MCEMQLLESHALPPKKTLPANDQSESLSGTPEVLPRLEAQHTPASPFHSHQNDALQLGEGDGSCPRISSLSHSASPLPLLSFKHVLNACCISWYNGRRDESAAPIRELLSVGRDSKRKKRNYDNHR